MNDVSEWHLLISSGVNAILCGNRANLDTALSRLCPYLVFPVHEFSFIRHSSLPSMAKGTLIVADVNTTLVEQRMFLEWLNAHSGVRVITLSEVSLFDLVVAGSLLEDLYYHLNPIYYALARN